MQTATVTLTNARHIGNRRWRIRNVNINLFLKNIINHTSHVTHHRLAREVNKKPKVIYTNTPFNVEFK